MKIITAWLSKINPVIGKLTADIPANPAERTAEQQARWILANVLDWLAVQRARTFPA